MDCQIVYCDYTVLYFNQFLHVLISTCHFPAVLVDWKCSSMVLVYTFLTNVEQHSRNVLVSLLVVGLGVIMYVF